MTRLVLVGVACCALVIGRGGSQTFRSLARTVYIYATVQGRDGRLVTDLTRDDFAVLDDDRPQPITVFDNTPQKITLAVMLDMSNSMASQYARLHDASLALIGAIRPDDRVRLGTFGVEVALSPALTSDKTMLRRIVEEELWPGGSTPLWVAIEAAMASLNAESGRRVVLVFTDGEDSGFSIGRLVGLNGDLRTIRATAERDGYMIYAVGLQGRGLDDPMRSLADDTGGGHYVVQKDDDLGATFTQIVEELHHQYVIGFAMEASDGGSHKLTVATRQPGMKVRARKSYHAS